MLEDDRTDGDQDQAGGMRGAVSEAVALGCAEHREPDRLGEQQADHRVVATQPGVVRQRAPRRNVQTESRRQAWVISQFQSLLHAA